MNAESEAAPMLLPQVVSFRQPPLGITKATAPGVIGPGQVVSARATVWHWFSLARSPAGGVLRFAFSLGRLLLKGPVSPDGGDEPFMPGGEPLGLNPSPSRSALKVAVSLPRLQPPPLNTGQPPVLSFCPWPGPGPGTAMLPARPNAPEHPLLGGAA